MAVTKGSTYTFSSDVPTVDGYAPVGVVGITSNHAQSLYVLAFDMASSKLWLQAECRYSQPSIIVSWYVLYLRS
ncbi:hypothetical protein C1872_12580 [Eggerthella lenta]|jgi:hypothetical protein|uniref:Uncharacterized protein n=1 Tax=Eggerthella lenta TaxID=84112 RepID=A0A369MRF8_EGGLN|nr:hypothetical protein C1872_12580 [Eggerthella lenta]